MGGWFDIRTVCFSPTHPPTYLSKIPNFDNERGENAVFKEVLGLVQELDHDVVVSVKVGGWVGMWVEER